MTEEFVRFYIDRDNHRVFIGYVRGSFTIRALIEIQKEFRKLNLEFDQCIYGIDCSVDWIEDWDATSVKGYWKITVLRELEIEGEDYQHYEYLY